MAILDAEPDTWFNKNFLNGFCYVTTLEVSDRLALTICVQDEALDA